METNIFDVITFQVTWKRNKNILKRQKVIHENKNLIQDKICTDLDAGISGSPHCLVELSTYQWSRISPNYVLLE